MANIENSKELLEILNEYKERLNLLKGSYKAKQQELDALRKKEEEVAVVPEEVEKVLDERSKLGLLGDKMGTYTQYQSAQAIRDAAKNPSGGNLAGLGVGLGAGVGVGRAFQESLATAKDEQPQQNKVACVKCGAMISPRVKFCPECGASQKPTCPKCGEEVNKSAKFCPNCGEKLVQEITCPKCGKVCKAGVKFCPECGEKLSGK